MSTLIDRAAPIPAAWSRAKDHQSNSWPILATLLLWLERHRQREALRSRIDDERLLNDIGLSREQVQHELAKPFWQ